MAPERSGRFFFKVFFVFPALASLSCTPPPRVNPEELPGFLESLYLMDSSHTVLASGSAEISIQGEKHGGSVEVTSEGNGRFEAGFYGPLGVLVASVKSSPEGGVLDFNDVRKSFAMDRTLDTVPFSCCGLLTFRDFLRLLSGRLPAGCRSRFQKRPDSVFDGRKTITAVWKTDSLLIAVEIKRKAAEVNRVVFHFKRGAPGCRLTFIGFKYGLSHKIELRQNDENYFSISFSTVRVR